MAAAIWAVVFTLELIFWTAMLPVVALNCLSGFLMMLGLSPLLKRALRLRPAGATFVIIGLLGCAILLQSLIEVSVLYVLVERLFPGTGAAPGYIFPRSLLELAVQLGINLRLNLWYFGFYALAVTMLHLQRSRLEARLQMKTAELEVLRLQLAPHFLFNALNSLNALVATRRTTEAEDMIHRLSDFFRSVLRTDAPEQCSLGDEIASTEGYLEIEQIRFGSRLEILIEVPDALREAIVPTMILHPLTENVVKHAVSRSSDKIRLIVLARQIEDMLEIRVHNTLPRDLDEEQPGLGLGHRNLRRRLAALRSRRAGLDAAPVGDGYQALVRLPLVTA